MTDDFFTGEWEGYYIYGKGYSAQRRKIKVGFYLKMSLKNGVLNGTVEEYVTKVHLKQPAKLSGSMEGQHISFTKQYPCYFEIDVDRNVNIDKDRTAHPVHYSGKFDPVTNTFSGDWELRLPSGDSLDEAPARYGGSWGMRKV